MEDVRVVLTLVDAAKLLFYLNKRVVQLHLCDGLKPVACKAVRRRWGCSKCNEVDVLD